MKFVSLLVIFSLIFISCASYTRIKKLPLHEKYEKEINYLGKDHSGKITLKDNQIISSMKMFTTGDSLKFLNKNIAHYDIVSLKDVKMITFKDHTIGIFYGLVGGGLGIGLLGLAAVDRGSEAAIAYAGYIAGGAILGALLGGFIGIDRNYIFVDLNK